MNLIFDIETDGIELSADMLKMALAILEHESMGVRWTKEDA